jgi:hypothetical protein
MHHPRPVARTGSARIRCWQVWACGSEDITCQERSQISISIGDIVAYLRLNDSDFDAKLAAAQNKATTAGNNIGKNITDAVGKGLATLGAVSSAAFAAAIGSTVQWGQEVLTLSRNLGMTTEQASGLLNVAEDLGVSASSLSVGFGIFAKNLSGVDDMETLATGGSKVFREALAGLNDPLITAALASKDFNALLPLLADHIAAMPDGLEKTALMMQLFGRSGKDLTAVMDEGGDAIRNATAETVRFGTSMSPAQVANVKAFGIAGNQLRDSLKGIAVTIGNELIPMLTPFFRQVTDGIVTVKDFVAAHAELIAKLLTLGTVILGPLAALKSLSAVGGLLGLNLAPLAGVLGALVPLAIPIAAVAGAVLLLVSQWNHLMDALGRQDMTITVDHLRTGFENLTAAISDSIPKLREFLGLTNERGADSDPIKTWLEHLLSLKSEIGPTMSYVNQCLADMSDKASAAYGPFLSTIPVLTKLNDLVSKGIPDLVAYGKGWLAEAAAQALAKSNWLSFFGAIAQGAASVMETNRQLKASAIEASQQTYGQQDYDKLARDAEGYYRKIAEDEENIRRIQGVSTSKKDNWRFPDPDKIKELQRDIQDMNDKIADGKTKSNDMTAANVKAGNAISEAAAQAKENWGKYFSSVVMGQLQAGTITVQQADLMETALGKTFGGGAVALDKFTLTVSKASQSWGDKSVEGMTAFESMVAEASAADDPTAKLVDLLGQYNDKQAVGVKNEKDRQKLMADNGLAADNLTTATGEQTTKQEDANKKAKEFLDYITSADGAIKTMTDIIHKVTFQLDILPPGYTPPKPNGVDLGAATGVIGGEPAPATGVPGRASTARAAFASGVDAIFRQTTPITVGERGPERVTVTPLSNGGAAAAPGTSIQINIHNPTGTPTEPSVMRSLLLASYLGFPMGGSV